jgi:hypothetical protein
MVDFNKKAAVLGLVAEGVTSPKKISEKILERHGQTVAPPAVSVILYNHRRAAGISMRRRRGQGGRPRTSQKPTLQIAKQSPSLSLDAVSGAHLVAALNFVRACGGDVRLATQAVELVKRSGLHLPVQNEG